LKTTLSIAVRELVEHTLRSGDLNLDFSLSISPAEGIRAHQKIQQSRAENYTAEVPITHTIETDRFILKIGGRIDGIFFDRSENGSGIVVIDEIKTTTRPIDFYRSNDEPAHWGQVRLYAFMYAVQNGLGEIDAQLTYYRPGSGETLELRRRYILKNLEVFFDEVVTRYLKWATQLWEWTQSRDASIRKLGFPFEDFRPGQRNLAVSVYRSIAAGSHLIIQAATGIGKTMATIFPAVKALGERRCKKIFFLTARTTGQAAAENALESLRHRGLCLKSLTLTAKDKICMNADSACTPEDCTYAQGYYDRIPFALKEFFVQDAFSRKVVERIAREYRVCPFEFSLELSLWADCILCDYNYGFNPRAFLRRLFLEKDGDFTFLVDEAHNLVDRSREMFSSEIQKQAFLDLRRKVKQDAHQIYRTLGKINSWFVDARKKCERLGESYFEKDPPEELLLLLKRFLAVTERWMAWNDRKSFRSELIDLYFAVAGFLKASEQDRQSCAVCFEPMKKDLKVKIFCIDPSVQLGETLMRCRSAVFFSGTMTPTGYFKKMLGCRSSAQELVLPSPFPRNNLGVFILDRISTRYRHRDRTAPDIGHIMASFVGARKGNYLLFFPSYDYMAKIHDLFQAQQPETDILLQTPRMSESQREAFLVRFQAENTDTLVGFAVMGGIFGEGIDLEGERLSGVAAVGVGLPGICLERELIREYFDARDQAGFDYSYIYPGFNRVLQAAGRVIRSEKDRGVVLLIDERFSTSRYKSLLPGHWHPRYIRDRIHLDAELKKFWRSDTGQDDARHN